MYLIDDFELYEFIRIRELFDKANDDGWLPDYFWDHYDDYFEKEEAINVTNLMQDYEKVD